MSWRDTLAQALQSVPANAICALDAGALQVASESLRALRTLRLRLQ